MLYIIFSIDRVGVQPLRDATREAHIQYMDRFRHMVVLGGGMLADDGASHRGSAIIVNVSDRSEAEIFASNDPFKLVGIYESQKILRMRKGYWNPQAAPLTAQDD